MENNIKPVAANFSNTFFVKSETFIRNYLSNLRDFHPICLAWQLQSIEGYRFPPEDLYGLQLPRFSMKWWYYGLIKKLLGGNPLFESILKQRKVNLIHAHFGHNGVQALAMRGKSGVPLVTTFYGADVSMYRVIEQLLEDYRRLFREGQLFLVEGLHMKEKLHLLGCPLEKIRIQRIAIPIDTIAYKERKPKADGVVRLLFCGRFTEKKGLIYALEAVKRVKERNRKISFCIIGDGELKKEIHSYVLENHLEDCVELPGFLNYTEYLQRAEAADIFLHPSVTAADGDSEGGAPTTILEAQAMGLPVISTFHADIPNIVVPDQSALLSKERDVEGIYNNIISLVDHPERWMEMGKQGRQFVEKFHDIKKETPKLEEKYAQCLKIIKPAS